MSAFRTLPLDRGAERSVATLRLVAAAAVAIGAIWLILLRPPAQVWLCVILALVASFAWIVMALGARRRLRRAEDHRLVLDAGGLALFEGENERRVAWDAVDSIETDEERLVVEVRIRDEAAPIVVEPRYGGLGLVELEEAIRKAKEEAAGPASD